MLKQYDQPNPLHFRQNLYAQSSVRVVMSPGHFKPHRPVEARLQEKHQTPQTLVYWQGARDGLETFRKRVAKRAGVGFSAFCPEHVMLVLSFKDEMWAVGRRATAIVHVTLLTDSADLGQQKSM